MAVTYRAIKVVHLNVSNDDGSFPRLPTDPNGVIKQLNRFMDVHKIYPAVRGGVWGGHQMTAMFTEEDANAITKFLESIGVEERKDGE